MAKTLSKERAQELTQHLQCIRPVGESEKWKTSGVTLIARRYRHTLPFTKHLNASEYVIGYDPGPTNSGLAFLGRNWLEVYQITLPSKQLTLPRYYLTQSTLRKIWIRSKRPKPLAMCIENAAFGAGKGQHAQLAESRLAAALFFRNYLKDDSRMYWVAPNAVRKEVFNHGNAKAEFVWDFIGKDAASATACACCAALRSVHA